MNFFFFCNIKFSKLFRKLFSGKVATQMKDGMTENSNRFY